jgi:hypothetical protein
MAADLMTRWLQLVERVTGLSANVALHGLALDAIQAALERVADKPASTAEEQAANAARLALDIAGAKPARVSGHDSLIAAETACDYLRSHGWATVALDTRRFARDVADGATVAFLLVRLLAECPPPDEQQDFAVVYISVPVSTPDSAAKAHARALAPAIEEELESIDVSGGPRFLVVTPGLTPRGPFQVQHSVRRGLASSAAHIVIGAGGGTPGLGIEVEASIAARRPVIWLVPDGSSPPQSIAACEIEGDVTIVPVGHSAPAVRTAVREHVLARVETIRAVANELKQIPAAVLELQQEIVGRWTAHPPSDEELVKARIKRARAERLVYSPFAMLNEMNLAELGDLSELVGIDLFIVGGGWRRVDRGHRERAQ